MGGWEPAFGELYESRCALRAVVSGFDQLCCRGIPAAFEVIYCFFGGKLRRCGSASAEVMQQHRPDHVRLQKCIDGGFSRSLGFPSVFA